MKTNVTTRGLAVMWWKLCYQLFSPTLFYLTRNGTNRRLSLAFICRVQDRTKNTELSSDKKTDGDFSLLCQVYGEGAPALVAVMFQCVLDRTNGMIEDQQADTGDYTLHFTEHLQGSDTREETATLL